MLRSLLLLDDFNDLVAEVVISEMKKIKVEGTPVSIPNHESRFLAFVGEKESVFKKQMVKLFNAQKDIVLGSLSVKALGSVIKKESNPFKGWVFPGNSEWTKRLAAEGREFFDLIYEEFGDTIFKELRLIVGEAVVGSFDVKSPGLDKYLKEYSFKFASGVMSTTEEAVKNTIEGIVEQAMNSGLSNEETARLIGEQVGSQFDNWTAGRSEMIARTETIRASNGAATEAYKQTGGVVTGVQWWATADDRTCEVCEKLDGKVIRLNGDDKFFVPDNYSGGEYPPRHPFCRCTVVPLVDKNSLVDY